MLADHCGRQAKGLLVPEELLFGVQHRAPRRLLERALSTASGSAGGDLVALDLLAGEFIETLNVEPQVFALGAR